LKGGRHVAGVVLGHWAGAHEGFTDAQLVPVVASTAV
jgi:hypothetical protein